MKHRIVISELEEALGGNYLVTPIEHAMLGTIYLPVDVKTLVKDFPFESVIIEHLSGSDAYILREVK